MFVIGISGVSGSGKSSVSKAIYERFPNDVSILEHDMYYFSKKDKPFINNYDHPDALETNLLIHHINELKSNRPIDRPIYDFRISDRLPHTVKVDPKPILIIEGLLIFCIPELIPLFDLKIYIDVPLDQALIRRIKRDHIERGRSLQSILQQYESTVRDAAINLVIPSRYLADIIVPQGVNNHIGLEVIFGRIRDLLAENKP